MSSDQLKIDIFGSRWYCISVSMSNYLSEICGFQDTLTVCYSELVSPLPVARDHYLELPKETARTGSSSRIIHRERDVWY